MTNPKTPPEVDPEKLKQAVEDAIGDLRAVEQILKAQREHQHWQEPLRIR